MVERDELSQKSDPLFIPLGSEELIDNITCIESLCMSCYEQGETKLLLTKIPHYKDVVVSSFNCPHCFYANTEIQSCEGPRDRGVTFDVSVNDLKDLNRQVVKGEFASISVPQVNLEIPMESQKGVINTVEGILQKVIDGLKQDQKMREALEPENYQKVKDFCESLAKLKDNPTGFSFILDDPSGNSFVENPYAPLKDKTCDVTHYIRTLEQDKVIGITAPKTHDAASDMKTEISSRGDTGSQIDLHDEVLIFTNNCQNCGCICRTNMKQVKIPFFKEVIIMATICDECGFKSDEVKSGAGIEPKGVKLTCKVQEEIDLSRDVLKSETCSLSIPELELELEHGSLGGRFTTIEGLVNSVLEGLANLNPFLSGDSSLETSETLKNFKSKASKLLSLEEPFTIVMDDPGGNSFISKIDDADNRLLTEEYERSFEQNEFLGINHMKTEDYSNDVDAIFES